MSEHACPKCQQRYRSDEQTTHIPFWSRASFEPRRTFYKERPHAQGPVFPVPQLVFSLCPGRGGGWLGPAAEPREGPSCRGWPGLAWSGGWGTAGVSSDHLIRLVSAGFVH